MQSTLVKRSSGVGTFIITAVLWLITTVLAFWEILLLRDIGIGLYLHYASSSVHVPSSLLAGQANVIGQIGIILGGIIAIAIVPAGAEYHYWHFGTPKSWRMFGYVFGFQALVILLATFI